MQRPTVPLSEISRVAIEETLGNSSWITAAPADLSWKERERERGRKRPDKREKRGRQKRKPTCAQA